MAATMFGDIYDQATLQNQANDKSAMDIAQLTPGRGSVYLAGLAGGGLMKGIGDLAGVKTHQQVKTEKVNAIMKEAGTLDPSNPEHYKILGNKFIQEGFPDIGKQFLDKGVEQFVSLKNAESNRLNASKTSGTSTDPNIALKRQKNIDAADWIGKQTSVDNYKNTLENQEKQLVEMKNQGWMDTTAYGVLQKEIDDTKDDNVAYEKSINDDVKVIANRWVAKGIPEKDRATAKMEALILKYTGKDGSGNLPGINVIEKFSGNVLSTKADAEVIQALAAIENALLKERSGAAVTDPEYTRFLKEVQAGFADDAAVIRFIKDMRAAVERSKEAIKAGFRPEVQNRYFKQAGIPKEGSYQTYNSPEDVKDLPIGTYYYSPDGKLRQKKAKKENN